MTLAHKHIEIAAKITVRIALPDGHYYRHDSTKREAAGPAYYC